MRVDLKKWEKENFHYLAAWIAMGLTLLIVITCELGVNILLVIAPFLPLLVMALARRHKEMGKC